MERAVVWFRSPPSHRSNPLQHLYLTCVSPLGIFSYPDCHWLQRQEEFSNLLLQEELELLKSVLRYRKQVSYSFISTIKTPHATYSISAQNQVKSFSVCPYNPQHSSTEWRKGPLQRFGWVTSWEHPWTLIPSLGTKLTSVTFRGAPCSFTVYGVLASPELTWFFCTKGQEKKSSWMKNSKSHSTTSWFCPASRRCEIKTKQNKTRDSLNCISLGRNCWMRVQSLTGMFRQLLKNNLCKRAFSADTETGTGKREEPLRSALTALFKKP